MANEKAPRWAFASVEVMEKDLAVQKAVKSAAPLVAWMVERMVQMSVGTWG